MSDDVKAVFNPDGGYTDNYFGGQGSADGPGHGHIRADEQGDTSIVRGSYTPGEPYGRANALEQDSRGYQSLITRFPITKEDLDMSSCLLL